MADVPISLYTSVVKLTGENVAPPSLPPSLEETQPAINPPGTSDISGLVPYNGAIDDVNLGEKGLSTGFVQYDNTPTDTPTGAGTVVWNPDKYTLDLSMGLGDSVQQIGMETYYTPVKNQTGSLIPDGTFVMATGSLGASGRITVAPAVTDGSVDSRYMLGVTTHDIANGGDGLVTWFGEIRGFNTNTKAPIGETWVDGTVLWNNPAVAGGFTSVEPQSPNLKIPVAIVISAGNNGVIFVRPRLGMRLTDLHDVDAFTPNDKDLISYDSALGHWNSKSLGSVIGGTSSQFLKGDGSLDSNTYALASSISGTTNYLSKFTGAGTIGDSAVFESGGNLLIGTTTDSGQKLQVSGESQFSSPTSANNAYNKVAFFSIAGGSQGGEIGSRTISADTTQGLYIHSVNSTTISGGQSLRFHVGALPATATDVSTERMRITSSGNVGIGTTSPTFYSGYTVLTLGGSAIGLLKLRSAYNSGNGFELYQNTSGDVFFNINSNDIALLIKPNGNTLIGTTTDSGQKLQVSGNAYVSGNVGIGTSSPASIFNLSKSGSTGVVSDIPSIVLTNKNTTNSTFVHSGIFADTFRDIATRHYSAGIWFNRIPVVNNLSSGSDIIFGASNNVSSNSLPNERMRITYTGNVGIGTSSPSRMLSVQGTAYLLDSLQIFATDPANGLSKDTEFVMYSKGQNTSVIRSSQWRFETISDNSFGNSGFRIRKNYDGGSIVEFIRINSGGNVGIGTNAPTNTLDVNGTARIRTLSNATGDFVTASATGVLQKRTASEVKNDLGVIDSKWTDVGSDIYRNSKISVGQTSAPLFDIHSNSGIINLNQSTGGFTTNANKETYIYAMESIAYNSAVDTGYVLGIADETAVDASRVYRWKIGTGSGGSASTGHDLTISSIARGETSYIELIRINDLGYLGLAVDPTRTLDVNGQARIRSIPDLGTAANEVLVPNALGELRKRTVADFASDLGVALITVTNTNTDVGSVKYNGTTPTSGNFYGGNSTPTSTSSRLNFDGILASSELAIFGIGFFQNMLTCNETIKGNEFTSHSFSGQSILNNGTYQFAFNPSRSSIFTIRSTTGNSFAIVIAINNLGTITFSTIISNQITVGSGTNVITFQNTSGGNLLYNGSRLDLLTD